MTPLALADGRVVLVNRGWIAQQASRAELPEAPPPAGEVTVRGRLALPPAGYLELQARRRRRSGLAEPRSGALRRGDGPRRAAGGRRGDGARRFPTTGSFARGRRPISASRRIGSTWCSGTRSRSLAAVLWLWFHRPRASGAAR